MYLAIRETLRSAEKRERRHAASDRPERGAMPASGGRLSHDRAEGEKAMGPQGPRDQAEAEGSRGESVSNASVTSSEQASHHLLPALPKAHSLRCSSSPHKV